MIRDRATAARVIEGPAVREIAVRAVLVIVGREKEVQVVPVNEVPENEVPVDPRLATVAPVIADQVPAPMTVRVPAVPVRAIVVPVVLARAEVLGRTDADPVVPRAVVQVAPKVVDPVALKVVEQAVLKAAAPAVQVVGPERMALPLMAHRPADRDVVPTAVARMVAVLMVAAPRPIPN